MMSTANCTTVCSRSSNTGRHRLSLPRSLHSPGCHRPALPKKNSIHLSIFRASQAKKKPTGAATKTYATCSFTFTNGISFSIFPTILLIVFNQRKKTKKLDLPLGGTLRLEVRKHEEVKYDEKRTTIITIVMADKLTAQVQAQVQVHNPLMYLLIPVVCSFFLYGKEIQSQRLNLKYNTLREKI